MKLAKFIYHLASLYISTRSSYGHMLALWNMTGLLDEQWLEDVQVPGH